ncbi:conjugal transfer protein [Intrasporangium sp.]|uniref:conjugal transfer protein n=1 Tax=Intrasporangium sp. TaxID=1925024 RepID=UPI0032213FBD
MSGTPQVALAARLVPVLAAAAVAAGVAAQVELRVAGPAAPAAAGPAAVPGAPPVQDTSLAADTGVRVLQAWAGASTAGTGPLRALGLPVQATPATPLKLAGIRVVQVSPARPGGGLYRVLLTASFRSRVAYFAVPVQVADGRAAPVALPSLAAAPALSGPAGLAYPTRDVAAASPLVTAVEAFLQAYLAGADVTRFTSPGAVVAAPQAGTGLPLERVLQVDTTAARPVAEAPTPAEGSHAGVLVSYAIRTPSGPLNAQIGLELRVRAGRWEIAAVAAAPEVAAAAAAVGPATAPVPDSPDGQPPARPGGVAHAPESLRTESTDPT